MTFYVIIIFVEGDIMVFFFIFCQTWSNFITATNVILRMKVSTRKTYTSRTDYLAVHWEKEVLFMELGEALARSSWRHCQKKYPKRLLIVPYFLKSHNTLHEIHEHMLRSSRCIQNLNIPHHITFKTKWVT